MRPPSFALVVIRVGLDPAGQWVEERRNVVADYRASPGPIFLSPP